MANENLYLEPLKYYEYFLKDQHLKNIEECFDGIAKDSKVDVDANKSTCKKYYAENNALTKLKKSLNATKAGIFIMIFLMIVGVIGGIICLVGGINSTNVALIVVGVVLLVIAVVALILLIAVFRKKKKNLQSLIDKKQKVVDQLQLEAYKQVEPLNGRLTPDLATKLMEKTAPLIDFAEYLSSKTE